jgi:hypothetical protein
MLVTSTFSVRGGAEDLTESRHIEKPHPVWFITDLSYGAGAMEFHDDQEAILPASLTLQPGFRYRPWRFGATFRWLHTGDRENFLETGIFFGGDLFSIEQDRQRSLAAYLRAEISPRFSLDRGDSVTLFMAPYLGIRAFGIFLEAGFGPVFGPFDKDFGKTPLGMTGEGRIGLELFEFVNCLRPDVGCFRGPS